MCADDAQDAYQRALEIYLRRVETVDPATEVAWLKVVVKHEAMAVRRLRQESVTAEEIDFDAHAPAAQRSTEDRLESTERVARSAEAMRRLKPDEAKALMLKAEGLSYQEIGARLSWTYTKVNRCITEGRRRFMAIYEQLETGAECERILPVLTALAHGTAPSAALLEIRPHLRNCTACRATVRELHASRWRRVAAFLPIPAIVAPARAWIERLKGGGAGDGGPGELRPMERQRQLDEAFRRIDNGDAAAPVTAEHIGRLGQVRIGLRAHLEAALQRLQSSDLALGIHATGAGGGRAASIAALIGVCVSGVGAGTYCVATALLPDAKPAVRAEARPAKRKPPRATATLVRLPAPASATSIPAAPKPAAERTRTRARTHSRPPAANSPKTTPVSHEQAPVSPAPAGVQEFAPAQLASSAPSPPAEAPTTGGGEFTP